MGKKHCCLIELTGPPDPLGGRIQGVMLDYDYEPSARTTRIISRMKPYQSLTEVSANRWPSAACKMTVPRRAFLSNSLSVLARAETENAFILRFFHLE